MGPEAGAGGAAHAHGAPEPALTSVPIRVALLGSGGSIGRQTVDVLSRHADMFRVVALATGSQAALLEEQARLLRPATVALGDGAAAARLDLPAGTTLTAGPDALQAIATRPDVDLVVVATGGLVALRSVLAALAAGKIVATANKETLVAGGHLVMPLARALAARAGALAATRVAASSAATPAAAATSAATSGAPPAAAAGMATPLGWLRPIDSEHSAIWQCLAGEDYTAIERLLLTASGGPFRDASIEEIAAATPEQALRHPNWSMGAKITIDSATLANKGLEIIEARWLYDVSLSSIEVIVHPQSVVHSAVQFVDGSLKAQLGVPDMRLPIQYALTYPARRPSPAVAVDLIAAGRLDFRAPDDGRFPALRIAREAGLAGPRATAAFISADEVAVARFLGGRLDFQGIARLLGAAVERFGGAGAGEIAVARGPSPARFVGPSMEELIALDSEVRAFAEAYR